MEALSPEYKLHLKEIISFLNTVTIKFSYFETLMNSLYTHSLDILNDENLNFNPNIPFVDLYYKDRISEGIALSAEDQKNNVMFSDGSFIVDSAYVSKAIFGTNRKNIINRFSRDILITKEELEIGLVNINNQPIVKNPKYSYPYYINMNGEYHKDNEMMSIFSVTSNMLIDLTKENLDNDPVTKNLYINNTSLMDGLFSKYPNQIDLIKAIFYPIPDIDKAISSDNLTLIHYDSSFLHANERENILLNISEFLKNMEYRWYLIVYEYENLYPLAFWAMVWYKLFEVITTSRISNLKTNQAHPFHIWEYLESNGLKGYKGFLTDKQSLFLYRNINYLKRNKGKKFILDLLEDMFIKPYNHSLVSKVIYHNTEGRADYADWKPEVLELKQNETVVNEIETIERFQNSLYDQGFEVDNSSNYITTVEQKFSSGKDSILRTKFFEIIKSTSNNFDESFYLRFLYDTIMNLYSNNKIDFFITLIDSDGNKISNISIYKAMVMLNWCFLRIHNNDINLFNIPIQHNCTTTIKFMEKPLDPPEFFYIFGDKYTSNNYLDLDVFYDSVDYATDIIDTPDKMSNLVLSQYSFIVNNFKKLRYSSDFINHNCLRKQLHYIVPKFVVPLESSYITYGEFFMDNPEIESLLNYKVRENTTVNDSINLIQEIFKLICPLTTEILQFMKIVDNSNLFWEKIKELFISLSSYDVAYILREKLNPLTFNLHHVKMHPVEKVRVVDRYFDGSILGCNNMEFGLDIYKLVTKEISYSLGDRIERGDKVIRKSIDIKLKDTFTFRKTINKSLTTQIGNDLIIGE